jgi:NAD(P)-dependent dehydrogenase (short-subunit alcohol dehydrogenase family)
MNTTSAATNTTPISNSTTTVAHSLPAERGKRAPAAASEPLAAPSGTAAGRSVEGVTRVLITGSTTGLGEAAARQLVDDGHEVVLDARNAERAAAVDGLARRAAGTGGVAGVVLGDLADTHDVRRIADQVGAVGRIDAVIHNAGVYAETQRNTTPQGHARTFCVNVLAPYLLTAWIAGATRLVYLSSGMHESGDTSLRDLDWTERRWNGTQAYCESKLHVTTLAMALTRRWPDRYVNVVDPGWVPTRMGGPGAPDDLELCHRTQAWLAVSDDPEARTSGGYWYHQQLHSPATAALDETFQDALLHQLFQLTHVSLP